MASRDDKPNPRRPDPRLYLVSPRVADPTGFAGALVAALGGPEVAAVMLRLAASDERRLINIAKALAPIVQDTGAALLIAEQNLDFCLSLAQKAYVMSGGTVARTVAIDQLRTDKALLHEMLSV